MSVTFTQAWLPIEGAELRRDLSQFFTPAWLADRLWRWALPPAYPRAPIVLEPSAGNGALVKAMLASAMPPAKIIAFDVDPENITALQRIRDDGNQDVLEVRAGDFLAAEITQRVDIAVMNPPFEENQDVAFIARALLWAPVACVIAQARIEHSDGRKPFWCAHRKRRSVKLMDRPRFGGDQGGMTDFVLLDIVRRERVLELSEIHDTATEERW